MSVAGTSVAGSTPQMAPVLPPPTPTPDRPPAPPINTAPPSYDEVMGTYKTSLADQIPTGPRRLAYIDIMPRCTSTGDIKLKQPPQFDKFSTMLISANLWLQKHPYMKALKCETIERKAEKIPGGKGFKYDFDSTNWLEPMNGVLTIVKGLRIWLTEKTPGEESHVPQLASFDVVQDKVTVSAQTTGAGAEFFVDGHHVMAYERHSMFGTFQTYALLRDTVTKLNGMFQKDPLPGTILNIELVPMRRNAEESSDIEPSACCCMVDCDKPHRITFILRVYFLCGAHAREEVGYQCIVPPVTKLPERMYGPQFQTQFDTSIYTANSLAQLQGRRIVSIQQHDARYFWKDDKVYVAFESMDQVQSCFQARHFLKLQVIFFTQSSTMTAPPPPTFLHCKIFVPIRTGRRSYENMTQTMYRVIAWLNATGARYSHVDSFDLLYNGDSFQGVNFDQSYYQLTPLSGYTWVKAIRLYFNDGYQEADPALLPLALDWNSQEVPMTSSCCLL